MNKQRTAIFVVSVAMLALAIFALPNFEDNCPDDMVLSDEGDSYTLYDIHSDLHIRYRMNEDGSSVTVTGLKHSDMTALTIPESIKTKDGNYKITAIGDDAFSNIMARDLKNIRIEAPNICIGNLAFYNCNSLETISFAGGVSEIGELAFFNCNSLKDIEINGNDLKIHNYAFMSCSSLMSLKLSGSVASIGQYVFMGCTALHSVYITGTIELIDNNAFYRCNGLKTVNLPAGMKSIGDNAFKECGSIERFIINGDNKVSLGNDAFYDAFAIAVIPNESPYLRVVASSRAELITSGIEHPSNNHVQVCVVIPPEDTVIEERAFRDSRCDIVEVIMHDNITKVEMEAFAYTSIFKLDLPDSLTYIGDRAFKLNKIHTLIIPENVTYIGDSAFDYCTYLSSVSIPESVEHIGASAFAHSISMREVYFSHSDMLPEMPHMSIYGANSLFYNCQKTTQGETHEGWYPTLGNGGINVYIRSGVNSTQSLDNQFNNLNIIEVKDYIVTFDPNGGTIDTMFKTVKDGECVVPSVHPPSIREEWGVSYIFKGWCYGDELYDLNAPVTEDIVLTASWERSVRSISDDNNNMIYFLITLAIIIIAVISVAYIYIKKK